MSNKQNDIYYEAREEAKEKDKTPEKWEPAFLKWAESRDDDWWEDQARISIWDARIFYDFFSEYFASQRTQDREEIIKDIEKIKDEEDYTIIHTVPFGPEIQSICSQVWRQSIEHIIYILNSKKGEI